MSRGLGHLERKIIDLFRGKYSNVVLTPEMCAALIYNEELNRKAAHRRISKCKPKGKYLRDFELEKWIVKNYNIPLRRQYNSTHRALLSLQEKGYIFHIIEHENFRIERKTYHYYGAYCSPIIACEEYVRILRLRKGSINDYGLEKLIKPVDEYKFPIPTRLLEMAIHSRNIMIEEISKHEGSYIL